MTHDKYKAALDGIEWKFNDGSFTKAEKDTIRHALTTLDRMTAGDTRWSGVVPNPDVVVDGYAAHDEVDKAGDTQAALDAIFLTICQTTTWPSGEECQQGRITLEQYNIIRAALTAQPKQPDVNAELLEDKKRLDFLDLLNARQNERYTSNYGWKIDINHNRVALTDHNFPKLSVREAIDEAIARVEQKG